MNPVDHNLIQRCLAKEAKAWDEFVERYSRLIYDAIVRTFERYGHPRQQDVLADLHNDIFVLIIEEDCRVLRQFEGRNGCQLGHYLRTVSVRRAVDFLRKIKPTVSLDDDTFDQQYGPGIAQIPHRNPDAPVSLIKEEQNETLRLVMNRLTHSEREFCRLIMVEGLNPEQISKKLRISIDYFYVRKKRLIEKLRSMVRNEQ